MDPHKFSKTLVQANGGDYETNLKMMEGFRRALSDAHKLPPVEAEPMVGFLTTVIFHLKKELSNYGL